MRGSREAPNWVWRARRGRWAKVNLTPGGMENTILDRPKKRAESNFSKEGKSFHVLKNVCEI